MMLPYEKLEMAKDKLEEITYCVVCQNCSHTFWETNLWNIKELMRTGEWGETPMAWYVKAAHHWLENPSHLILVLVGGNIYFDLSENWSNQAQGLPREEVKRQFKQMLGEIP